MLDEDHEYVSSFESVLVEGDQGLIKQAVRVLWITPVNTPLPAVRSSRW